MRTWIMLLLLAVFMTGCGTQQPIVKIEHVVVTPQDNLLVDCDVQAPPSVRDYLGYEVEPVQDHSNLLLDPQSQINQLTKLLRQAEARNSKQTDLNLKNYQYIDTCNQRWAKLREWKAEAMKLNTKKKE